MKLSKAAKQFRDGHLSKQEFIVNAHETHSLLFDYSEMLKKTPIASVEISKDGVLIKTDEGLLFTVSPDDLRAAPIEAINFGSYESELEQMMEKLLSAKSTMLDIGANIGWYSLRLAKKIPGLRVFSFEPAPATYGYLTKNLALNNIETITPVQVALSEKETTQKLFFSQKMAVNASLANINPISDTVAIEVNVSTIDTFVKERKISVDFIKCDVEGAEFLALKGGSKMLGEQRPAIVSEMLRKWSAGFGYHPNELILFMKGFGYQCFTIQAGKIQSFKSMVDSTVETNFVFLHQDKHAAFVEAQLGK